ncbi:MAG: hypothetical protein AAF639_04475 [Chloroflexota bacterium]
MTRRKQLFHKIMGILIICSLLLASFPESSPHLYAHTLLQEDSTYTYQECNQIDRTRLRTEIEQIALTALVESRSFSVHDIVTRKWVELNVDGVIDEEVDHVITNMYNNEGYWSRLWSGWSSEKAQEFAETATNEVFNSPSFKQTIEGLSSAIAQEITAEIEAEVSRAASVAFLCLKSYVGGAYSNTLFQVFETNISQDLDAIDLSAQGEDIDVSAIQVHQKALGGLGIIIVTEITRRIAIKLSQKITQRIAGKIVGRIIGRAGSSFVPVAGWIIGAGLIVWDLFEGGQGALPQIEAALKDEEVKAGIQNEITDAVEQGMPDEVAVIAKEISIATLEEWDKFCLNHDAVCDLAVQNPQFQDVLNYTTVAQFGELSALVSLFMERFGREELDNAIVNGTFERLMPVQEILYYTNSVPETLEWVKLASNRMPAVLDLNLYSYKPATEFSIYELDSLIEIASIETGDNTGKEAVNMLLLLQPETYEMMLSLPTEHIPAIINRHAIEDIRWFADYLVTQPMDSRDEIAAQLATGGVTIADLQATANQPTPTVIPSPTPESVVQPVDTPAGPETLQDIIQRFRAWTLSLPPEVQTLAVLGIIVLLAWLVRRFWRSYL